MLLYNEIYEAHTIFSSNNFAIAVEFFLWVPSQTICNAVLPPSSTSSTSVCWTKAFKLIYLTQFHFQILYLFETKQRFYATSLNLRPTVQIQRWLRGCVLGFRVDGPGLNSTKSGCGLNSKMSWCGLNSRKSECGLNLKRVEVGRILQSRRGYNFIKSGCRLNFTEWMWVEF